MKRPPSSSVSWFSTQLTVVVHQGRDGQGPASSSLSHEGGTQKAQCPSEARELFRFSVFQGMKSESETRSKGKNEKTKLQIESIDWMPLGTVPLGIPLGERDPDRNTQNRAGDVVLEARGAWPPRTDGACKWSWSLSFEAREAGNDER